MNTEKILAVPSAPQRICAFILPPKTIEVAQSHFMVSDAKCHINVPFERNMNLWVGDIPIGVTLTNELIELASLKLPVRI
ncbi:hypothetical protein EGM97_08100 [Pseudomonas sp. AF32]|uniref:hypothetical protein n=1 Tax=Pseudomonas sp. AF32 TaxID=554390 RepID=UPI001EEE64A1|nr:hypothetical protein [Pseudomonas sp. AF32]MCG6574666.1 hypothetical protein [Pseudomonas sp. AF32]